MKIIAVISRNTFLIEANSDELAKCVGQPYGSGLKVSLEVGAELNVTEAYEHATAIISSSEELESAKRKLLKTVGAIENMQAKLDPKAASIKAKLL